MYEQKKQLIKKMLATNGKLTISAFDKDAEITEYLAAKELKLEEIIDGTWHYWYLVNPVKAVLLYG
jgi:hypothetical protein